MAKIKIVTSLEEAKLVWSQLSPRQTWYDEWDVRYEFYRSFNYPLRFYTCFSRNQPVAVLPLQFNTQKRVLEFFGTKWFEENRVFHAQGFADWVTELYKRIECPAQLLSIRSQNEFTDRFETEDYKYFLDLRPYSSMDEYLQKEFKRQRRKDIKWLIKKLEKLDLELTHGSQDDLELLFQLNIKRFGDQSSFYQSYLPDAFRRMINLDYHWQLLVAKVNGQKRAVSIAVLYQDTYIYHNSGTDINAVSNLGSYLIYKNIEKAILLKARVFDAGPEDLGWKEHWHLRKRPQYKLIIPGGFTG